jgi:hypothetical protein
MSVDKTFNKKCFLLSTISAPAPALVARTGTGGAYRHWWRSV